MLDVAHGRLFVNMGLYLLNTGAIDNSYAEGTLSIRMEALSLLYTAAKYYRFTSNGHGKLFINMKVYLLYTAATYNSYRDGWLSGSMEALSLPLYSCYIQLK